MTTRKRAFWDGVFFCTLGLLVIAGIIAGMLIEKSDEIKAAENEQAFMTAISQLGTRARAEKTYSRAEAVRTYSRKDLIRNCQTYQDSLILFSVLYSTKYSTPSKILIQIKRESEFNRRAIGALGERGLMQIMPSTALQVGYRPESLFIPEYNVRCGTRVLEYYADYYGGYMPGLAAYASGKQSPDAMAIAWRYHSWLDAGARRWAWLKGE